MTGPVRYAENWSSQTGRPFPERGWLRLDEARATYDQRQFPLMVVDASHPVDEHAVSARWLIGFSSNGWVRVTFFSPAGSIIKLTDYAPVEGRLWRRETIDYTYPDDDQQYFEFQCLRHVSAAFEPDGSATVVIVDKEHSTKDAITSEHVNSEGFWMDRPAFGDWDDLTNPDYGVPPD